MAAHQAPPSLGFSGKNTGVDCHFLLQCMKVKSESEVAQSCLTLHDPMDCSLPGSSVHGIFQARVLEWGAIAFSKMEYYSDIKKMKSCHLYNMDGSREELYVLILSLPVVPSFRQRQKAPAYSPGETVIPRTCRTQPGT